MELLQRVADAGGRLLRAERLAPGGIGDAARAPGFLLTFDVGRILVTAEPGAARLALQVVDERDQAPLDLVRSDEEDPWWRVLGSPLAAVRPAGEGSAALQFRRDDDNPRIIRLDGEVGRVRVSLDPIPAAQGGSDAGFR